MESVELFRIMIGPATHPSRTETTRGRIQAMERSVTHVLRPLGLIHRLEFLEAVQFEDRTRWLVVNAQASTQVFLFEEIEQAITRGNDPTKSNSNEQQDSLAFQAMQLAFTHLQILCNVGRWAPSRMDEWIRNADNERTRLNWPLDPTTPIGLLSPGKNRFDLMASQFPKRVILDEPVLVHLDVEMIGHEKACVSLSKKLRRQLRIRTRTIELHWWSATQPEACPYFESAWRDRSSVSASVYVTVNRSRDCIALQFDCISPETAMEQADGPKTVCLGS